MNFLKPKFWDQNGISFLSILLLPITLIISFLSQIKFLLTKTHKFSIPIICVGNIYLGGTGKTPLAVEIFKILKNLNINPVFIRKKYDSYQDEVNLQKKIGPVYQNKKRANAINEAINNKAQIAVLDDGFQDSSIKKDLSIICFNEQQWVGNGFTIPSGPLRESLSALKRANLVVINGQKNIKIEDKILKENKKIKIFYAKYKIKNIEEFENKKVIAFAGIGNPNNFFSLLKENNIVPAEQLKFPDHYNYSDEDLENLINKSKNSNLILLTTETDYLRISENYRKKIKYLAISLKIENQNQLIENIKKII